MWGKARGCRQVAGKLLMVTQMPRLWPLVVVMHA